MPVFCLGCLFDIELYAKAFSFLPLSMMLAVGLPYTAFMVLRYVPPVFTSKVCSLSEDFLS